MATGRGDARRRSRRAGGRCGVRHRVVLLRRSRGRRAHRPAAADGDPRPRRPRTVAGHRGRATGRPVRAWTSPAGTAQIGGSSRRDGAGVVRAFRPRPRGARARDAGPRRHVRLRRGPADGARPRLPGTSSCTTRSVTSRRGTSRLPRTTGTWFIDVHGHDGGPRGVAALPHGPARAGMPVLVPTYRNDLGAPASPDGIDHLGPDRVAGRERPPSTGRWTTGRATWCSGAGRWAALIVLQVADRSDVKDRVRGLVLDSPGGGLARTCCEHQGADRGLPPCGDGAGDVDRRAEVRARLRPARLGVAGDASCACRRCSCTATPTPSCPTGRGSGSPRPGPTWSTLHLVPNAGHTLGWNTDPAGYERVLTAWLRWYAALPTPC